MASNIIKVEGKLAQNSRLNGEGVVLILQLGSGAGKTGAVDGLWFAPVSWFRKAGNPYQQTKQGRDGASCGGCIHSSVANGGDGTCYTHGSVLVNGANSMVKALKRKGLEASSLTLDEACALIEKRRANAKKRGRKYALRLGVYGDPSSVEPWVIFSLCVAAGSWTGYSHSLRAASGLESVVMASADSLEDAKAYWSMGLRTFRIGDLATIQPNEVVCPASEEAGKKTDCLRCQLCNGSRKAKSILIAPHGPKAKILRAKVEA